MARAQVRSIDVLHRFRMALVEYEDHVLESITLLELELRKALDWIDLDRSNYWPEQVRRSSDNIVQYRNDLERCEMAIRAEDRKSCMVERKALDRAKQRLRLCEQKVTIVKKWRVELHGQSSQMTGRLARIRDVVERELPNAIATMMRLITSLEQYAAVADGPINERTESKSSKQDKSVSSDTTQIDKNSASDAPGKAGEDASSSE